MSSKTDKMRDKLASIQKDRVEFEKKKKELAAQMTAMSNGAKRTGLRLCAPETVVTTTAAIF